MKWTDTKVICTESGKSFLVAKPAFVIALYGDSSLNPYGVHILDKWMELLHNESSLFYLAKRSHHFKHVTPRIISNIRKALNNLEQEGQFYMLKDAAEFAVGQYSIELNMGIQAGSGSANRVHISLPVDYPNLTGLDKTIELFQYFVDSFPVRHATAGYGFDLVWGREWEMEALPVIIRAARRYLALDVRHRLTESSLLDCLKGPGWLTYLHSDLLEKTGGLQASGKEFEETIRTISCSQGVIMQAGVSPPLGDVNRHAKDINPLRLVSHFLKPLQIDKWLATNLFDANEFDANEWFSRLD